MKLSRLEKAAIAARLRARGYTIRQIADELGMSRTYADGLLKDPDGSKDRARKQKYRGKCQDCGGPTSYTKGGYAKHCQECAKEHNGKSYWNKERIVEAIQRFAEEHGRRPSSSEWLSPTADQKKNTRFGKDGYPYATTVLYHFGSWANAIEAAGFERPVIGQYYIADRKEVARLRGERQRKTGSQTKSKKPHTLKSAAAELRKHSPWGVAPPAKDPRVYHLYGWATRNGHTWEELCKEAGVRSRKVNPFTSYT